MTNFIVSGKGSVHIGGLARLVEDDRELAWAEKHVRRQPDVKWVLGNYVEADNPNDNGHVFPLDELKEAQHSIANKPLNMLHFGRRVVGAYAAAQLLYPLEEQAGQVHPHIEALAAFWRYYFKDEYELVERAHAEGSLFFSMEAIPDSLVCLTQDCGQEFKFGAGLGVKDFCAHLNMPGSPRRLKKPHFIAGALILPPVRPGWRGADVKEMSALVAQMDEAVAHDAYEQVKTASPHLNPQVWEFVMEHLLVQSAVHYEARDFSADQRKKLSKEGKAMSDGSFPIVTRQDLLNAIRLAGRAANPSAAKAHIKKRAKALGLENLIPDGWN